MDMASASRWAYPSFTNHWYNADQAAVQRTAHPSCMYMRSYSYLTRAHRLQHRSSQLTVRLTIETEKFQSPTPAQLS